MKIILLSKIGKLGNFGEIVSVKSGYARNFLFPKSKAIIATKNNVELFQKEQLFLKQKDIAKKEKAEFCAEKIRKLGSIVIKTKSGVSGKLFGSVGSRDIAKAIMEATGYKILKNQIRLPNHETFRLVGKYEVGVQVYHEVFVKVDVVITSE